MTSEDILVEQISQRIFDKLAGAGVGKDPEDSLASVVDRLVARDGRDATVRSLLELAEEISDIDEEDDDDDPDA